MNLMDEFDDIGSDLPGGQEDAGSVFGRLSEIANRDSAVSVTVRADDLRAILAQQGQGEPVALPARKHHVRADYSQDILAEGWNGCLDEIAKLGPLYTHADPAEVDRWKKTAEHFTGVSIKATEEVSRLRAQLAEAHALLREIQKEHPGKLGFLHSAIADHLSASAEPSVPKCETCYDAGHVPEPMSCKGSLPCPSCAPVEIDERAEFESTLSKNYPDANLRKMDDGNYAGRLAYEGWKLWQARAALERKP